MEIVLTELLNQWSNKNSIKSEKETSDIIFAWKIEHRNRSQIKLLIDIHSFKRHFHTKQQKNDQMVLDKSFTNFFVVFIWASVHCWYRRSWRISQRRRAGENEIIYFSFFLFHSNWAQNFDSHEISFPIVLISLKNIMEIWSNGNSEHTFPFSCIYFYWKI